MKQGFAFYSPGKIILWFLLLSSSSAIHGLPSFPFPLGGQFFYSGSWNYKDSMLNRADLRLFVRELSLRAQAIDKRPALFWEPWLAGTPPGPQDLPVFSGGLYHNPTGSRLLYGVLEEWGLSARLQNPWGKSLPLSDSRRPQGGDLKTQPSSTKKDELYLYLRSYRFGPASLFVSAQLVPTARGDFENLDPGFGSGVDFLFNPKTTLRLEGFFTEKQLPAYDSSAWFSGKPPLPERRSRLTGFGFLFASQSWSVAGDGGYSETFALGRGWHGALALRAGDKPWRFSLGVEAGGGNFSGRDGVLAGPGLRGLLQTEWKGKRSALFRLSTSLSSNALEATFNRSDSVLYLRFPGNWRIQRPFTLRPGTLRFSADRDGRNPGKIIDSLEGGLSGTVGILGIRLQGGLSGISGESLDGDRGAFCPYPVSASYRFNAAKGSGELSWNPDPFKFRLKGSYQGKAGKTEGAVKSSLGGSFSATLARFSPGKGRFTMQFGVKIDTPQITFAPEGAAEGEGNDDSWNCVLSWRLTAK